MLRRKPSKIKLQIEDLNEYREHNVRYYILEIAIILFIILFQVYHSDIQRIQ